MILAKNPGWNIELHYQAFSGASFGELFLNLTERAIERATGPFEFGDNFVNMSLHQNLGKAKENMLIIYSQEGKIQENLIFRGNGNSSSWFSETNLVNSSLWSLGELLNSSFFVQHTDVEKLQFEIISKHGNNCEEIGFLKMTCNMSTECKALKWRRQDETLQIKPYALLVSSMINTVDLSQGSWVSKFQILSRTRRNWEKVLMVEAFAGVDWNDYYQLGRTIHPLTPAVFHPKMVFRDPTVRQKIETAEFVKLLLYYKTNSSAVS